MENINKEAYNCYKKEVLEKTKKLKNGFENYFQEVMEMVPLLDDLVGFAKEDKSIAFDLQKFVQNENMEFIARLIASMCYVKTPADPEVADNLYNNIMGYAVEKQLNEINEGNRRGSK